jgi:hypothetical protein
MWVVVARQSLSVSELRSESGIFRRELSRRTCLIFRYFDFFILALSNQCITSVYLFLELSQREHGKHSTCNTDIAEKEAS